jgi:hypothetical protein
MAYNTREKPLDFTEIAQPPKVMLKLFILEARLNLREAIEYFNSKKFKGQDATLAKINIKTRLGSLIFEINEMLKGTLSKKDAAITYEALIAASKSDKETEIFKAIDIIENILYTKKLTKVDDQAIDSLITDTEDEAKGY